MPQKENASIHASRFSGRGGNGRLLEAIAEQFIVGGDKALAGKIARKATLASFRSGDYLMNQGDEDTDLMLILGGAVQIVVNGREVGQRRAGEHVGEMALLDTNSVRSATVRAVDHVVVARISEFDFDRIARRHSQLWRRLALTLAQRLRERSKYHSPPRVLPAVFIGSSSEGLAVAECIYNSLKRQEMVPRVWTDGVFEASKTTIESLVKQAAESDFAVMVLTPDDLTASRGRRRRSPRDNVLFELGLFMGALARERTIVFAPSELQMKIPTDLLGVTFVTYNRKRGQSLPMSLKAPIRQLKTHVTKYGPR